MGCDIHLYVEEKVNGKWQIVSPKNSKYPSWYNEDDIDPRDYEDKNEYEKSLFQEKCYYTYQFTGDRNYNMFGFLANVRGDLKIGIGEPKGIPTDCSEEFQAAHDCYGSGAHSTSYCTFAEFLKFKKTDEIYPSRKKMLDNYNYIEYKKHGGAWGASPDPDPVRNSKIYPNIITNEEMDFYTSGSDVVDIIDDGDKVYYTVVECPMVLANIAQEYYDIIDECLGDKDPKNLRFCFFFDN